MVLLCSVFILVSSLQQAHVLSSHKALDCAPPCPNLGRLNVGMWGLKLGSLGRTLALVLLALEALLLLKRQGSKFSNSSYSGPLHSG